MTQFDLEKELLKDYDRTLDKNGVSGHRLAQRLGALSKIGLTELNGANRPGYSFEERKAKDLVKGWMEEVGLTVREDEAGNLFGRLAGKNDSLPVILSGSHVDSVPNGGHFDGTLGVLAALEVVEAWKETGYQPEKPYEVVVFSDEEGARFNSGLHGSKGMMGTEVLEEKLKLVDSEGLSFSEVFEQVGLKAEDYLKAKRDPNEIEVFAEVHIEQGKRLEKANLPCGIVTGIAGSCRIEFTFTGKAGHAGNTPMNDRKDALLAASEFVLEVNKLPKQYSDSAVATVGKLDVEPNGVNVIAGKVTLYVDTRDIYKDTRDRLADRIIELSQEIGNKHGIKVDYVEKTRVTPVQISDELQGLIAESLQDNGIDVLKIPSGAGHDAMILGEKIPVAMIFVRSKDGISHNPAEWSDLNDCVQGVHVLKTFIEKLQNR